MPLLIQINLSPVDNVPTNMHADKITQIVNIARNSHGIGLKRIAQAMMIAVSMAKLLNVPSKPKRRSKSSIIDGKSVVNIELPAVTMPFTRPRYFLK